MICKTCNLFATCLSYDMIINKHGIGPNDFYRATLCIARTLLSVRQSVCHTRYCVITANSRHFKHLYRQTATLLSGEARSSSRHAILTVKLNSIQQRRVDFDHYTISTSEPRRRRPNLQWKMSCAMWAYLSYTHCLLLLTFSLLELCCLSVCLSVTLPADWRYG